MESGRALASVPSCCGRGGDTGCNKNGAGRPLLIRCAAWGVEYGAAVLGMLGVPGNGVHVASLTGRVKGAD